MDNKMLSSRPVRPGLGGWGNALVLQIPLEGWGRHSQNLSYHCRAQPGTFSTWFLFLYLFSIPGWKGWEHRSPEHRLSFWILHIVFNSHDNPLCSSFYWLSIRRVWSPVRSSPCAPRTAAMDPPTPRLAAKEMWPQTKASPNPGNLFRKGAEKTGVLLWEQ